MKKMTGAEALIECLKKEGAKTVFGIPGGVLLPIFDALYSSDIDVVLMRHEQCAAHAADGFARTTGQVGVCIATSGPGATNVVTGIANAYMDSIPIVCITGQVATSVIGTDAFQEADITGITMPITKHNYLVKNAHDLPRVMKEAFHIARTGRPGPVVVDIPVDVARAEIGFTYPETVDLPGYKPTVRGNVRQITKAVKAMIRAERPLIFCGGGVVRSGAEEELTDFAIAMKIPVVSTLMGKGGFPETHELSLGMSGMHGGRFANYAVNEADLLIALGMRFDDRVTGKLDEFAPNAKVVHVDIDPAEIGKNIDVDIPVVGDIKSVLHGMLALVKKEGLSEMADRSPWLNKIAEWKRMHPLLVDDTRLTVEFIIHKIYELTKDKHPIIATGVGQHQMWTAQYFPFEKPNRFVSSGGLGTMGFGLPSAIGAQVGNPNTPVFCIDGDGSFQMVLQDLATCAGRKLPIKFAIMNNGYLGMVRQWQELFYGKRYSSVDLRSTGTPDFLKLADAYGLHGIRITKPEEVEPAIKEAMKMQIATIMDFVVEREENVFPMVAPGAPIRDMIGGE